MNATTIHPAKFCGNLSLLAQARIHFLRRTGGPDREDWFALAVGLVAFIGMLKLQWSVVPVVLGSGTAGLIYQLILR
jgi:hypothetical protein